MVTGGVQVLLIVAKTVTLVCGGILTLLSARAARRTGSPALRTLALGIGLLTVGALTGGASHQYLGLSLEESVSLQSVFTATGLGVMTYSLYAEGAGRDNSRDCEQTGGATGD
ncbi:MAG: hypothetical protein V5A30_00410 [Haloarculaceae archaeon]